MYNYKKMLGPHERVYYFGGVHWITMVNSLFFCLVLAFAAFSMIDYMNEGGLFVRPVDQAGSGIGAVAGEATNELVYWFYDVVRFIPWLMIGFGLLWVIKDTIHYICTKVLLTSHRMVVKKGLVMVRVHEIELDEVEAANVNQLVLGRMFSYGQIHLDARLVDDYDLPILRDPYRFVKILHILKDYDIGAEEQIGEPIHPDDLQSVVAQDDAQEYTAKTDVAEMPEGVEPRKPNTVYKKPMLRKTNSGSDKPRMRKKITREDLDFLKDNEHA